MTLEEWHLQEADGFQERQLASEYVPHLEAHRSDQEPDRIERLRRVYGLVQNLFLLVEKRPLPPKVIVALHDRKGRLVVTCIDQEWQEFLEPFFRLAWRSESEPAESLAFSIQQ